MTNPPPTITVEYDVFEKRWVVVRNENFTRSIRARRVSMAAAQRVAERLREKLTVQP